MVKHDCGREASCPMNAGYRKRMAEVIPTLDTAQRTEVYSLLVKAGVRHTSNSNGKFFEISSVPCSALNKLKAFIDHCERTSTDLVQTETERSLTAAFARTAQHQHDATPQQRQHDDPRPPDSPQPSPATGRRAGGQRRHAARRPSHAANEPPGSEPSPRRDPVPSCSAHNATQSLPRARRSACSLMAPDFRPAHTAKDEAEKFVQARKRYCKQVLRKVVLRNELSEEPVESP